MLGWAGMGRWGGWVMMSLGGVCCPVPGEELEVVGMGGESMDRREHPTIYVGLERPGEGF